MYCAFTIERRRSNEVRRDIDAEVHYGSQMGAIGFLALPLVIKDVNYAIVGADNLASSPSVDADIHKNRLQCIS